MKKLPISNFITLLVVGYTLSFGCRITLADTSPSVGASSTSVTFDSSLLNMVGSDSFDLSYFQDGASALPGNYKSAVYINGVLLGYYNVEFKVEKNKKVYPCLGQKLIKDIQFNPDELPIPIDKNIDSCIDLKNHISTSYVNYDSGTQHLDIIVPQAYLYNKARGEVHPELWDEGINSGIFGYNINGYSSRSNGENYNSLFANFRTGINIGAWQLRHNGNYSSIEGGRENYNAINTYIQRDIPSWRSSALVGQSNTSGQIFDTLPFVGLHLASDRRMLPESQQGYAPQIRGVAKTNARVFIRQNDQIIYETNVTPGEFLINDLYPTGFGGDLVVTVRESDASEHSFKVPYASVTQLLRPGTIHYEFTAGKIHSDSLLSNPDIYQATYQYGVNNTFTSYGGLQASDDYYAVQLGGAIGSSIGAFALDITHARTRLGDGVEPMDISKRVENITGQSYRLSYSKAISETNTNLSLAAYRFSTDGYMDFMTAMHTRDAVSLGDSPENIFRSKNRFTVTAAQSLPNNWGQFYLSGSLQDYWNQKGTEKQYHFGYNNRYKILSYGLSINRSFSSIGTEETNYLLSFSLPLGKSNFSPQMMVDLSHDTNGNNSQQLAVSGVYGAESELGYGATITNTDNGGTSHSLNANYRGHATTLTGSYSHGSNYNSAAAGINGTVIAHSGGITLTPYVANTFALVEAIGAEGASVSSYPGIHLDSNGYAAVPYLKPYQINEINIDPKGTSAGVELESTSQKVAPHAGAVVKLSYKTKQGNLILVKATYEGNPLPFGAYVTDGQNNHVGTVGQGGVLYARVDKNSGQLNIKWSEPDSKSCSIDYEIKKDLPNGIHKFKAACH
ncbi:fimbria/pilus outer membrane usher protein [Shewanella indica]